MAGDARIREQGARPDLLAEFADREYRHGYVGDFLNCRIAAQIRAMRLDRGWTQKELARRAGMKQARIPGARRGAT